MVHDPQQSLPGTAVRIPLFGVRALLIVSLMGTIVVVVVLRWLLGVNGASLLVAAAAGILFFFTAGELIRGRLQISLHVVFAAVTLAALSFACFGARFMHSRRQLQAVETIVQGGGHVTYRGRLGAELGGGWLRTGGGWIVPVAVHDFLGRDFFDDVDSVYFGKSRVPREAIESIANAGIQDLSFDETPLDADTVARIGSLSDLHSLAFFNTNLNDANIEQLTGLSNLEYLVLGNNPQITESGMELLSRLPKLEALLLPGSSFRGSWCGQLAKIPHLKQLVLSGTSITDADLAGLAKLSNLEHLSLADTSVSDGGNGHLSRLSNLKSLNLTRTNVTDSGVTKLKTALPHCQMVH